MRITVGWIKVRSTESTLEVLARKTVDSLRLIHPTEFNPKSM